MYFWVKGAAASRMRSTAAFSAARTERMRTAATRTLDAVAPD